MIRLFHWRPTAKDFKILPEKGDKTIRYYESYVKGGRKKIISWCLIDHFGNVTYNDPITWGLGAGLTRLQWRNVVDTAIRHNVSDGVAFEFAYSAIKDLKVFFEGIDPYLSELVNPDNLVLSRDTIRRQRKKVLESTPALIRDLTSQVEATMWAYDGKAVKDVNVEKSKQTTAKEMLSLSSTGKTDADDFEVFVAGTETVPEKKGTESDKNAKALLQTVKKQLENIWGEKYAAELKNYKGTVFGLLFDTTSTNTGWKGGFNSMLEILLESGSKLNIPCRNHLADTSSKYFFRHEKIDGATTGGNTGGVLTALFNDLNEWLKTGENWKNFREFVTKKVKVNGVKKAYAHKNKLLTNTVKKKLQDILMWMKSDGAVQFKRGDYLVFYQSVFVFLGIQTKFCKSDVRNDPTTDPESITELTPVYIINKLSGIHHARFFSRNSYSVWIAVHEDLLIEFAALPANSNDQKLQKIVKQLVNKDVHSRLDIFTLFSCIQLDHVFRTHSKQAIINEYRYLMNIYFKV